MTDQQESIVYCMELVSLFIFLYVAKSLKQDYTAETWNTTIFESTWRSLLNICLYVEPVGFMFLQKQPVIHAFETRSC